MKQLWVAAIDQAPAAGQDPSHPAFWLPGQDLTTLNMRGYRALPPCKGDGMSCMSGTDCCGGYCDTSNDASTPADCCDANAVCINSVCSEPPPT